MKASELPLAPDGSLYHIRLESSTLADKVLLVGDPGRVDMFKGIFESVEYESQNREMHALTGVYHGSRMTALSTGMGCDNIDIVMTELDAALRVEGGKWNEDSDRHLQVVRIGTSGSLQEEVDCGSHVASRFAIGLDGLMNYYKEWQPGESDMEAAFLQHMGLDRRLARPYCVGCSELLFKKVAYDMHHGITATAPGFYGPQGRAVRLHPSIEGLNEKLASFEVTELLSDKVAEWLSDKVTELPSDKVTEWPSDKVAELPSDKVAELPGDKVAELLSDKVAELPSDEVTELPSDKVAELPSDKVAELLSDKVAELPGDKVAEWLSDKVAEWPSDKVAELPSDKVAEPLRITNLEMETSAIYGFSRMMGHEALTVCLIIANRPKGTFLNDYHKEMRELVGTVVERMV